MQACLDDLAEHMNGQPEPPGALTGKGISLERMRAFAEAAARFYSARPWEELTDSDLIAVEHPSAPAGLGHLAVLGNAGQAFGLGFFNTIKQFEKMQSGADPDRIFATTGTWSFTFGTIQGLPFADADLWEDCDLPVADEEAYPFVARFGPKKKIARPDAKKLAFLEGLLNAIAVTTADQLDAGRWSQNVSTVDGTAGYRLTLVGGTVGSGRRHGRRGDLPLSHHDMRRAMEKGVANLQRLMDGHEFGSIDDANAFIQANLNVDEPLEAAPRTPLEKAQDLMYGAWETQGRRRRTLARQALEICPDCADAYVLLAEETGDAHKACELLQQGVEAGERALGPEMFEEEVGHFWGIMETRPYMRARAGLAQCLWDLGRREEAVAHYEALLRLNPGDNQGIRYLLAACLLELGDDPRLGKLLDDYGDEPSAQWLYLRALWTYRKEGDTARARRRVKEAIKCNKHVPAFLSGKRRLPRRIPEAFRPGHEDEAVCCAAELRSGWKATPGAVEWLTKLGAKR